MKTGVVSGFLAALHNFLYMFCLAQSSGCRAWPSCTSNTAMKLGFLFAGVYGICLSLLILSGNVTDKLICIFCKVDQYTLGNFGEVWADWHAIGCAFVGFMNLSVAKNEDAFGPGKRYVAINSVFIYGVWACQNTYYCIKRTDLFTPLMWTNAILCGLAALLSFLAACDAKARETSTDRKQSLLG